MCLCLGAGVADACTGMYAGKKVTATTEGWGAAKLDPMAVEQAEDNVRSKSLKIYERRFFPERAYRVSMLPRIVQQVPLENGRFCELINIPLYAVGIQS